MNETRRHERDWYSFGMGMHTYNNSIGWENPVAPRKGFRQPKTSKHSRQKRQQK